MAERKQKTRQYDIDFVYYENLIKEEQQKVLKQGAYLKKTMMNLIKDEEDRKFIWSVIEKYGIMQHEIGVNESYVRMMKEDLEVVGRLIDFIQIRKVGIVKDYAQRDRESGKKNKY
jgi:hypothetical protein